MMKKRKTMSLHISAQTVPLEIDTDGVARVGGTRVTLDTVISAFKDGSTPEEIVTQYPSVALSDVYSIISYYLQQTKEVDTYLERRSTQAKSTREQNETRFDPQGVRDRLLARQKAQG
jgi:uncharacterized protein (DUF433 family)